MIRRGTTWLRALLICIDQFAAVLLFGAWHVFTGRGRAANPDETISSRVGRNAAKGKRWAVIAELGINRLFAMLGEHNHCRRSIEWDELG